MNGHDVLLSCRQLAVGYGTRRVISGVDAAASVGQFVAVVGPNGAGKSTLLRTLARLQQPLAGSFSLGGVDGTKIARTEFARRVAVVLTDRVDVAHLRVAELVSVGRHPHLGAFKTLRPADWELVSSAIAGVGAAGFAGQVVSSLSDGQRQRVLIARALVQEPDLMLLDEPTSFLDPPGRLEIMSLLAGLAHQGGHTVVISTHEVELALRYCDWLWVVFDQQLICGGPQQLAADGTIAAAFARPGVRFDPVNATFLDGNTTTSRLVTKA